MIQEHRHDDSCGEKICICTTGEENHKHDDSCYELRFVEEQQTTVLSCQQDAIPHQHSEGCYITVTREASTQSNLVCGNTDPEHIHDDSCYQVSEIPGYDEQVLDCALVYEPHNHIETCYTTELIEAHEEKQLICPLSEDPHVHDDSCYEIKAECGLEEHSHSLRCYSDGSADVETMLDWQAMFAAYPFTGNLRDDLVGIAKTQVGYSESTLNFEVGQDGIRRGYTRYGAWYGAAYSDWSAMFVSFCLNYAGADPAQTPGNTGANSMAQLWNNLGKYAPAGEYSPLAGDLVFFTNNTVGIVTQVNSSSFDVVQGDVDDAVTSRMIMLTDGSIAGWGITEGTLAETEEELPPEEPPPDVQESQDLSFKKDFDMSKIFR